MNYRKKHTIQLLAVIPLLAFLMAGQGLVIMPMNLSTAYYTFDSPFAELLFPLDLREAHAQSLEPYDYRGFDHLETVYPNGTKVWRQPINVPLWIETGDVDPRNGKPQFTPYKIWDESNYVTYETGSVSWTFYKDTCTFKVFGGGKVDASTNPMIADVSITLLETEATTENWQPSQANDAPCNVTINETTKNPDNEFDSDGIELVAVQSADGIDKQVRLVQKGGQDLETWLKVTNNNSAKDNHKFGWTESQIETQDVKTKGQAFGLEITQEKRFDKSEMRRVIDFGDTQQIIDERITIEKPNGVIHYNHKDSVHNALTDVVVRKYSDTQLQTVVNFKNFDVLPVGQSQEIDPTYSSNNPTEDGYVYRDGSCSGSYVGNPNNDFMLIGVSTGDCWTAFAEWNTSSITDGSDVTNTVLDIRSGNRGDTGSCQFRDMANKPTSSSASTIWNDGRDGTIFFSTSTCHDVADHTYDLGTDADADVESRLTANWWGFGIDATASDSGAYAAEENSGAPPPTLTITYTEPCVPDAPTGLTATAQSTTQIDLSWTNSSNCTNSSVEIQRSTDGGAFTTIYDSTVKTSHSDTGLTANEAYSYRVRLQSDSGENSAFSSTASEETIPPQVTGLSATTQSDTRIDLSWDNVAGDDENGYKIEINVDGGGWTVEVANTGTQATTYSDTGLTANESYQYRVSAISDGGTGSASTAVTEETIPPQVTGLSATAQSTTQIDLSWNNVAGDDENGYKIERESPIGGGWHTIVTNTGNQSTTFNDIGVSSYIDFDSQVVDQVGNNDGTWTGTEAYVAGQIGNAGDFDGSSYVTLANESNFDFEHTDPFSISFWVYDEGGTANDVFLAKDTAISPSSTGFILNRGTDANQVLQFRIAEGSNLFVVVSSDNSIPLNTWAHATVTYDGTSNQDGMKIYINGVLDATGTSSSITGSILNNASVVLGASSNGGTHMNGQLDEVKIWNKELTASEVEDVFNNNDVGLSPTTQYNYKISAISDGGIGAASTADSDTTFPDPPTSLTATAVSDSQINLSWTAPVSGTVDGYKIERESPVGGGWSTLVADTGNTNTSYSDTGLTDSTQYNYRVSALNGADSSTPSNEANDTTFGAPDQVTGLTVTPASTSQLDLSWNTPNANGFPITGYKIERESPVGGGWSTIVADTGTTATTYNDTGLSSGTQYNYRVSAINSFGTGAASTPESDYTLLEAPTSLVATPVSGTVIDLSWSAPSGTVTGYKIERESPVGGGWSTIVADTGTTTTAYQDTSLSLGTQYNYRVSAINTNADVTDTSSPSNEADATTFDFPSAPLNPFANATGFSSINFDWDAPTASGNTAIEGYRIWRESPTGNGWVNHVNNTASISTEYDDTGLTQNTQYNYKVQAWNSVGAGDNSTESSATTWEPVSGTVTIDQSHVIGDVIEANVTASMNFASPDPTIVSISLTNVTGIKSSESINLVNDTYSSTSFRLWGSFDGTKDIAAQLNVLNATLDTILLNSTTKEFTVEYEPDTFTSLEGSIPVNYTHTRTNNDETINLKANRGDDPLWNMECNFRTDLFGDEVWKNLTDVGAYEVNQTAQASKNTYIKCYNDELLFTTVSFGETNSTLAFVDFSDQLGTFWGVPIPFLFVIFLGAIFTGRSAPTGVFVIGGALSIMGIMGYFPDPTSGDNMITGTVYGLLILLVALGAFMGKRFF